MTFHVLHVCTGNICRSPMAEHLMREGLRLRLGERAVVFDVRSAGTMGYAGDPMQPFAHSTLQTYGVDGTAFVARALEPYYVEQADLILGATRQHRGAAVTMSPKAARRTFTLREFDRLLSLVDPDGLPDDLEERARELVHAAAGNRGLVRPDRPEDDDLEDPYQGPEAGYVTCAGLVHDALQRPLDLVAGPIPKG
jgi:protein-tyrosine phosphatase